MFADKELTLSLKKVGSDPQLVMIPLNDEEGILAVVKPYGLGQAACIAFAPATKRSNPFNNYKPSFLRKTVTNDFAIREGSWTPVSLQSDNALALRNAVVALMQDIENSQPESIQQIDMEQPANTSSALDAGLVNYRAPEHTPFEQALSHLLGIEARQTTNAQQSQNEENA